MPNITINIKNCGCCGGSSSGGTATKPFFNEPGDPNSPAGPPDGFSTPTSGLNDRQCKMAVWLYDWLETSVDTLGNTATGGAVLTALKFAKYSPFAQYLVPTIAAFISFVVTLFAIPGIGPDDAAGSFMAWGIAYALVSGVANVEASKITQPTFQSALPIIQANKTEIICQLAQATSATDAQARLESALSGKLEVDQQILTLSFTPDMLLNMLFFSADWWPSFDEDYLAGIAETCCGGYVNDEPITPGSTQSCQAANYIVDKLASTFYSVYQLRGVWTNFNPFDDNRETIYSRLEGYTLADPKIKARAYSYSAFLSSITEYIYSQYGIFVFNPIDLTRWFDLSIYFFTNHDALVAALQAAADISEAYDVFDDTRTWLDDVANIEEEFQPYILAALDALIKPPTDKAGILDLLFHQDADLANYAVSECGGGGGGSDYLSTIVETNIFKQPASITDQNELLGAEDSADDDGGMFVDSAADHNFAYVIGDFGEVHNNAIELQLRVRGSTQWQSWRLLDHVEFAVSEDNVDYLTVGSAYINQTYYTDGVWRWVNVSFAAVNVRYVKLTFNRGQAYGYYGKRWFDACKVVTE